MHLADIGAGFGAEHLFPHIGEGLDAAAAIGAELPLSSGRTSRWAIASTSPRARIQSPRSSGKPAMMSMRALLSVYGPEVS
jgi:hypothetical protein